MAKTSSEIYHNAVRRGLDNGYAMWLSAEWQMRHDKKERAAILAHRARRERMNDTTISTDGKQKIEIRHRETTYTIEVDKYGILRIHGQYTKSDGTLANDVSMAAACVDKTTMEVYLT